MSVERNASTGMMMSVQNFSFRNTSDILLVVINNAGCLMYRII